MHYFVIPERWSWRPGESKSINNQLWWEMPLIDLTHKVHALITLRLCAARTKKSPFFPLNFRIRYHLSVCRLFHESDVREIQYRICKDARTSRKILSEKVNKKCRPRASERAAREWYYLKVAGIIFQNTSPITTRRRKENGMRAKNEWARKRENSLLES